MENKSGLVNPSLPVLCQAGNKLNKEAGAMFAMAVMRMSLAKNIKLADGTIGVWEDCMIEDIKAGMFELQDFLEATKRVIREPLFNRIDYADIYRLARDISKDRWGKEQPGRQPEFSPTQMPKEVRTMLNNIGEKI